MALSQQTLTGCFARLGIAFGVLDLGPRLTLVVTTAGGRVLGPFEDGIDALGWSPDATAFEAALLTGQWNIGGERVWLAPERMFNFSDPARMLDTYHVDPALDPGNWNLTLTPVGALLETSLTMRRSDGGTPVSVTLSRHVRPLRPAERGNLPDGLIMAGYRQAIEVAHPTLNDGSAIVPWLIRQVVLGGDAVLSASGLESGQCVFGTPPTAAITPQSAAWRVPFGPQGFFKTSYSRQAIAFGGFSYIITDKGRATAVVLRTNLAAPGRYPETLPNAPRSPDQAAALFRDNGQFGTYGELELYGHVSGEARGALMCDALILTGAATADLAAMADQATEISSMPIS